MVKGISKQVIVVRSPDPRFFEQAIFIVREDALGREGVTDEEILKEAKHGANGRYACINLINTDTIEFRVFRGTLKYNTVITTLQFVWRNSWREHSRFRF